MERMSATKDTVRVWIIKENNKNKEAMFQDARSPKGEIRTKIKERREERKKSAIFGPKFPCYLLSLPYNEQILAHFRHREGD